MLSRDFCEKEVKREASAKLLVVSSVYRRSTLRLPGVAGTVLSAVLVSGRIFNDYSVYSRTVIIKV